MESIVERLPARPFVRKYTICFIILRSILKRAVLYCLLINSNGPYLMPTKMTVYGTEIFVH